jgi:hypothetical protein
VLSFLKNAVISILMSATAPIYIEQINSRPWNSATLKSLEFINFATWVIAENERIEEKSDFD